MKLKKNSKFSCVENFKEENLFSESSWITERTLQIKTILKTEKLLANIDEEHFVKIELVSDDQAMQKLLVNQMHPSVSIIQISKDSSNSDYQSNIINRITTNENTIEEIRNLIRAINTLSITDKDIIIARGILGIGLVQLAEHWKKKPETLRRCYIRALDSLAFTKGLLNF